jgi:hypothetical protein
LRKPWFERVPGRIARLSRVPAFAALAALAAACGGSVPAGISVPPAQPGAQTVHAAVRTAAAPATTGVAPATFVIFPSLVIGGQFGSVPIGYITVDSIASVDRTMQISSSNPAVATLVGPTVTIPAGADRTVVQIPPAVVSTITTATITVSGGGVSQSAGVTDYPPGSTLPPPILASIAANPLTVPAGASSTITVTLASPAPAGGLVLSLSSNLTLTAQIQPTVFVPAGARSASVPITTSIGFPNSTTTPTIEAAVLNSIVHTGINVVTGAVPTPFGIASVGLSPATVVGGGVVQGTVTMTAAAPAGGALVTLQSTDTSVATTPASVTVPAGAKSATFAIATSAVAAATSANIAGGFAGGFLTTTLHVNPPSAPAPVTPPVTPPPPAAPPGKRHGGN